MIGPFMIKRQDAVDTNTCGLHLMIKPGKNGLACVNHWHTIFFDELWHHFSLPIIDFCSIYSFTTPFCYMCCPRVYLVVWKTLTAVLKSLLNSIFFVSTFLSLILMSMLVYVRAHRKGDHRNSGK